LILVPKIDLAEWLPNQSHKPQQQQQQQQQQHAMCDKDYSRRAIFPIRIDGTFLIK
jgi:hypothetical protein